MPEPERLSSPSREPLERDLALARAAARGEPEARRALAERLRCVPRMLAVQNRRQGSPLGTHDLEDLSQEVVIVILRKLGTYAGTGTLEGWAHRICFLELMNRIRSRRRAALALRSAPDGSEEELSAPEHHGTSDYVWVEAGLVELGSPDAEVVRLKHYEQLTFDEIARVLDISPNTAKSRYYRGVAWLQRHLLSRVLEDPS